MGDEDVWINTGGGEVPMPAVSCVSFELILEAAKYVFEVGQLESELSWDRAR